jgi:mannose-6-phosphate isomerase-like protein (cupin superfamily)
MELHSLHDALTIEEINQLQDKNPPSYLLKKALKVHKANLIIANGMFLYSENDYWREQMQGFKEIIESYTAQLVEREDDGWTVKDFGRYKKLQTEDAYRVNLVEIDPNTESAVKVDENCSRTWTVISGEGVGFVEYYITARLGVHQSLDIPVNRKYCVKNVSETEKLVFIEIRVQKADDYDNEPSY